MKKKKTIIERFEEKIFYSPDGCWLWTAYVGSNGYSFFTSDKDGSGHRFSYSYFKGEIPNGMNVCHTCDIRSCVNPDHLFLGTTKDNLNDMQRKGRKVILKGTQCTNAKLTEKEVIRIKGLLVIGLMPTLISRCTGIPEYAIAPIKRGKIWKSVPPPEVCGSHRNTWDKISRYCYHSKKSHKEKRLRMLAAGKIRWSKYEPKKL